MQSVPREMIVDSLLSSLEAERYARTALLLTIADELEALGRGDLGERARAALVGLDEGTLGEDAFVAAVRSLREDLGPVPPESGAIAKRAPLARAGAVQPTAPGAICSFAG